MTEEQFKKFITRPDKFDDYFNYLICGLACCGGIYFQLAAFGFIKNREQETLDIYAGVFLLFLGLYGIWRIPKDYKIIIILSNKTLEEKRQIIETYLETLNVRKRFVSGELFRIQYRNKYWNSIDLSIAYDENQIFLSAKGADNHGGKGIIDFGLTRRALRKTEAFFKQLNV